MKNFKDFLKRNKTAVIITVIAVVVIGLLASNNLEKSSYTSGIDYEMGSSRQMAVPSAPMMDIMEKSSDYLAYDEAVYEGDSGYGGTVSDSTSGTIANVEQPVENERKIIRIGNFDIEVEDTENAVEIIKNYLPTINGYLDNISISEFNYSKQKQAYLTIRVPEDKFEEASVKFRGLGYVSSETVNTTDVTETYQDTQAQIENLKGREEKVREFYDRATTVEETLSIYQELENLRWQRESLEKELQSLERKVSYSTFNLYIYPEVSIEPIADEEWNIAKVWKEKVNVLIADLHGIAELLVGLFIYIPLWGPIVLAVAIVWYLKRKKRKKGGRK